MIKNIVNVTIIEIFHKKFPMFLCRILFHFTTTVKVLQKSGFKYFPWCTYCALQKITYRLWFFSAYSCGVHSEEGVLFSTTWSDRFFHSFQVTLRLVCSGSQPSGRSDSAGNAQGSPGKDTYTYTRANQHCGWATPCSYLSSFFFKS